MIHLKPERGHPALELRVTYPYSRRETDRAIRSDSGSRKTPCATRYPTSRVGCPRSRVRPSFGKHPIDGRFHRKTTDTAQISTASSQIRVFLSGNEKSNAGATGPHPPPPDRRVRNKPGDFRDHMPRKISCHAAGKTEEHIGTDFIYRLPSYLYPPFFYRLTSTVSPHFFYRLPSPRFWSTRSPLFEFGHPVRFGMIVKLSDPLRKTVPSAR